MIITSHLHYCQVSLYKIVLFQSCQAPAQGYLLVPHFLLHQISNYFCTTSEQLCFITLLDNQTRIPQCLRTCTLMPMLSYLQLESPSFLVIHAGYRYRVPAMGIVPGTLCVLNNMTLVKLLSLFCLSFFTCKVGAVVLHRNVLEIPCK